ncbi:MAG: family N-acetyltransferase [Symbiobacteriaceae bacterium]|jgi:RimJ/RimL family protein N-acetyltransferase|nr:family N-acetyltransferase [Symbiobacteriaceae bacterium]
MVVVRRATEADAEAWLALGHLLDRETSFMLLEPGERVSSVDVVRLMLGCALDDAFYVVAEDDGRLVGLLGAERGEYRRERHKADLFVGVLQAYAGQGLGRRLLEAAEGWARDAGLHRLELTVMAHNARAIALYEKMGFVAEGLARHSLCVDGKWVDEVDMGKLL